MTALQIPEEGSKYLFCNARGNLPAPVIFMVPA